MPCYHTMTAYRSKAGRSANGRWPIVFNLSDGYKDLPVEVPCGKCIGCRLERSRIWAVRCVNEASLYDKNCFITLTYSNENLDKSGSLQKRDFQLFMKKLRKKYGEGIRYFHCGEYGVVCHYCRMHKTACKCGNYKESLGRPHHHAILFNHDFSDKMYFSQKAGVPLYISESLDKLWDQGISTIGSVTFESAAYVARYCLKKTVGEKAADHYGDKLPEYTTMSRRPGIGAKYLEKYADDIYNYDQMVIRDGLAIKPPKYYDDLFSHVNPERMEDVKCIRRKKQKECKVDYDVLERRERVKLKKIEQLKRNVEIS